MPILILGGADDEHALHVLRHLQQCGDDAELVDSRAFPAALRIRDDPAHGTGHFRLTTGRVVDFAAVRSVYWRTYNGVIGPTLPDAEQQFLAVNDARSLFESILIRLPARWVNGWNGFQLHQTKPAQLARVAALGIPVPATLLGNDEESILDFVSRYPKCIFKPVQGGAHARRLSPAHLSPENLKNLALAPVTIQEEVPGTNIRVFVAGERVMACEIHTAELDYRDDRTPTLSQHELPEPVEAWCRAAAHCVELIWAGIDLRRTPEGQYVFLEANPSPMFLGFEAATGLPLTESLTSLLRG